MPIACMNGIEGMTCTPVAAEITPVIEADDAADPFFVSARDLEIEFAQADDGIDHQQDAEHDGAVGRIGAGQRARAFSQMPITVPTISGHSRRDDVAQIGADKGLPDIGDDRRHDDDGERLSRRHADREQAHRHRRQAEPEHALDEAGEQEAQRQ